MAAASTDTSTDTPEHVYLSQGAWMELVRRARIPRELKQAFLTIGSYANPDGTSIYCGVARLAADCEVSYRTASRYYARGREAGLVLLVERGNRRRRRADEYRLIADPQVMDHFHVPDPEQYRKMIAAIAGANRADSARRQHDARDRADAVSTDTDDDRSTDTKDDRRSGDDGQEDQHSDLRTQGGRRNQASEQPSTDTSVSVETRFYGHEDPVSTDIPDVLPPSMDHLSSKNNLPCERADLRNARLLSARAGEDDEKISSTTRLMDAPTCNDCGTMLDPDGYCFVCRMYRTRVRRAIAPAP